MAPWEYHRQFINLLRWCKHAIKLLILVCYMVLEQSQSSILSMKVFLRRNVKVLVILHWRNLGTCLITPQREQRFIYLDQSLLTINEQVKNCALIIRGKVRELYSAFCQLSQLHQTVFKFVRFKQLSRFFLVLDINLDSSSHDSFPDFFNAFDKETLDLILFADF